MAQPQKKISRRRFLALGVFGGASAAVGASTGLFAQQKFGGIRPAWSWLAEQLAWSRGAHLSPAERIRQHFGYLDLDTAGVSAFVAEYQKHNGAIGRFRRPNDEMFFDRYLLSTDFFLNGADESRPVHYVLFYDPYVSPCWNPCRAPATASV